MTDTKTSRPTKAGLALLVGAPTVMIVARLLLVPFTRDWTAMLSQMAAHDKQAAAGWLLAALAAGLLAYATAHIVALVRPTQRVLGSIAGVLTAAGWAGVGAIAGAAVLMTQLAKDPNRPHMGAVLKAFDNAGRSNAMFALCLLGVVGFILLAIAIARSGVASSFAAILVGLGGGGTLVTMPGPHKPILVLANALLLAGYALVGRSATVTTVNTADRQPAMAA